MLRTMSRSWPDNFVLVVCRYFELASLREKVTEA